jgi:hypothetical protein
VVTVASILKIDKDVHDELVQWQLKEQALHGRKMTQSDAIHALLRKVPIDGF